MPRILIADDEELIREMYRDDLTETFPDLEVDEVDNGKSLVEQALANQGQYSLILTDYEMPVMDGISAICQIRQQDQQTPIYMIAGQSDTERFTKAALEAGANGYFPKLISMRILRDAVKMYLR